MTKNLPLSLGGEKVPVVLSHSLDDVFGLKGNLLALDIETYPRSEYLQHKEAGLLPHLSYIRLMQFYDGENCVIIDLGVATSDEDYLGFNKDFIDDLCAVLEEYDLIAHNAIFETSHLQYLLDKAEYKVYPVLQCTQMISTAILHAVTHETDNFKSGLKYLAEGTLGITLDKSLQVSDWGAENLSPEQISYAAFDAVTCWKLYHLMQPQIDKLGLAKSMTLNYNAIQPVIAMRNEGIAIDLEKHEDIIQGWQEEVSELASDCFYLFNEGKDRLDLDEWDELCKAKVVKAYYNYVEGFIDIEEPIELDDIINVACALDVERKMLKAKMKCEDDREVKGKYRAVNRAHTNIKEYLVNINSGKQLSEWIKDKYSPAKILNWPKTPTGVLKTDVHTLTEFGGELIEPLLNYKKYKKLVSTYAETYASHYVTENGITTLHPNFSLCKTGTGRMSSYEPNLQNVPQRGIGAEYRQCFTTRPGNRAYICADFSQIEVRVAACMSECPDMLQAYENGDDIHLMNAMAVTGKSKEEITKLERTMAKANTFTKLFGGGTATTRTYAKQSFGVEMTEEEAVEQQETFRKMFPRFREWQIEVTEHAKHNLFVRTALGKLRKLDPDNYYCVSINTIIQGTAAEIMELSLIKLQWAIRASGLDIKIINCVHDEISLDCHADCVEKAKEMIELQMTRAAVGVLPNMPTRGLVEVEVGVNWAETH